MLSVIFCGLSIVSSFTEEKDEVEKPNLKMKSKKSEKL